MKAKKKNPKTEWELVKLKKKMQSKETTDKMKKTTYWIEENICEWYDK